MTTHRNRLVCTISNTPGASGALTVGAAQLTMRGFVAGDDGLSFTVLITDGSAWEVRTGCVYTHAGTSLSRGALEDSSTGSAIALTAAAVVTVTGTAAWATGVDAALAGKETAGAATAAVAAHAAAGDPHPGYLTPAEGAAAFDALGAAAAAQAASQPLDADLTAIAALTTTSYGRSLLTLADAAAGRTLLGAAAPMGAYTWAARPSATSAGAGARIQITDLGPKPWIAVSDGTYWVPEGWGAIVFESSAIITGTATTSQEVLLQMPVPALLLARRPWTVRVSYGKTGNTNTVTHRLRLGTSGTTADTEIRSENGLGTGNNGAGTDVSFQLSSATNLVRIGSALDSTFGPSFARSSSGTQLWQTNTVTNADSNALILSITSQMNGTTNQATLGYCALIVH